jgi:aminopeptidase N
MIVEACQSLKGRKGASRIAIKKWIEENKGIEVNPVYFRNGFRSAVAQGTLIAVTAGSFKAAEKAKKPKKAKAATKKKTASKKKATKKGSDYKTIKGKKYDKGMLDEADAAVARAHDNVISVEEASRILKEALDGHVYTATEKATMEYIRKNYKFTAAADKHVRSKVASFAAKKAAKKKTTKKK